VPKLVDHDVRREELADALWRVVMRDGIEAASVRRVAAEAGWSTGSLRHYFDSQAGLLAFAMELVIDRVTRRVEAVSDTGTPREVAERALQEVMPLDDLRRAEMQVWLAFTTRSFVDPGLRELRDRAHVGVRTLCEGAARLIGASQVDAQRIHALVDGLAMHAVLDPATTTPRRQRALLAAELDDLSR
jgi:AcrR family transcriptional regulator